MAGVEAGTCWDGILNVAALAVGTKRKGMTTKMRFTSGTGKYKVTLEVRTTGGKGLNVFLYGGTLPHVGGTVLASPAPALNEKRLSNCDIWSVTVPGHKDTAVAEAVARSISTAVGEPVCVCAGIHIDDASKGDIKLLYDNCLDAAKQFVCAYNRKALDPSNSDKLICVDVLDRPLGTQDKLLCHQKGILHRAFSVFLYHDGKLLIQQRAFDKYHSGGLWTNSCCSHPRYGERLDEAVNRRLYDELGIKHVDCREIDSFVYFKDFENGLCEYEYDHVFIGEYSGEVRPNAGEIMDVKWIGAEKIAGLLLTSPQEFTVWFLTAAPKVLKKLL